MPVCHKLYVNTMPPIYGSVLAFNTDPLHITSIDVSLDMQKLHMLCHLSRVSNRDVGPSINEMLYPLLFGPISSQIHTQKICILSKQM